MAIYWFMNWMKQSKFHLLLCDMNLMNTFKGNHVSCWKYVQSLLIFMPSFGEQLSSPFSLALPLSVFACSFMSQRLNNQFENAWNTFKVLFLMFNVIFLIRWISDDLKRVKSQVTTQFLQWQQKRAYKWAYNLKESLN